MSKVVCRTARIQDSSILLLPTVSSSALEVVAVTHWTEGRKPWRVWRPAPGQWPCGASLWQPPMLAPLVTAIATLLPSVPPLTVAACGLRWEE